MFASIVDDPSEHPELFPTPEAQDAERQRLFKIIEELVKWENCRDNKILNAALLEMLLYTKERTTTKKLIEVAMPLDIINEASAREKSIRHGHPSTLHLWWSRKPTATARAVLFASIVDDPSEHPEHFPDNCPAVFLRGSSFQWLVFADDFLKVFNQFTPLFLDKLNSTHE